MPAYVILIQEETTDRGELEAYFEQEGGTLEGHSAIPRVIYGPHEVLDGAPVEGVVLLEFPTLAEAKAWYLGPEYTAAKQYRLRGAEYRAIFVEGI
ncbi:DUF1330 domain-containing protein [Planctomicrobium sp. SH664]|uniref:DUF1330 domain-containing protein n=1 Tax=Planctomicrobium sp. SH664 TaxID=3448125 RepID=UPI003F5C509F